MRLMHALLAAALICTSATAWAQDTKAATDTSLESQLPADTVFYFTAPDLKRAIKLIEGSGMGDIAREPSVKAFHQKIWGMAKEQLNAEGGPFKEISAQFKAATGVELTDLPTLLAQGRVSLALTNFTADGPMPTFDLVATMAHDPKDERFTKIYSYAIKQAKQAAEGNGAQVEETKIAGVEMLQITPPDGPDGLSFCICRHEGNVIITTSPEQMKLQIMGTFDGKALSTNSDFVNARKGVKAESELAFSYINVQAILAKLKGTIPPDAQRIMGELGVDGIRGLGASWAIEGKEFVDRYFLAMPIEGEPKGIQRLFTFPKVTMRALKYVPKSANSYGVMGIDLPGLWKEGWRVFKAIDENAYNEAMEGRKSTEEDMGFKFDDLVNSLGTELTTWSYAPAGEIKPGDFASMFSAVYAFELKDMATFKKGFDKILDASGAPAPRKETVGGIEIMHFDMPADPSAPFKSLGVAFHDKMVFISLPSASLVRMAKDLANGAPTMAANPSFTTQLARYPKGMSSFNYSDASQLLGTIWKGVQPMVKQSLGQGAPFAFEDLPKIEEITKHIRPMTSGIVVDKTGVHVTSRSTVGTTMLVALGGVGAAMVMPAMNTAREKAKVTACANQLKMIGLACQQYKTDKGKYPESFDDLVKDKKYIAGAKPFVSPADPFPMKEPSGIETSYIYIYANVLGDKDAGKVIVAYNRRAIDGEKRHILYLDGSVKLVDEVTFKAEFKVQKDALKKHGIDVFPSWGKSK